jgi:hypothetical protein
MPRSKLDRTTGDDVTGRTQNRNYAFPECEPPLVKDRSDIGFMRDLAVEVDADAAALSASIDDLIERSDTVRIAFAGNITVTNSSAGNAVFIIPYDSLTYAQPAAMSDLTANGIRIQERGYYMVASYVRCTTNGSSQWGPQVRHLRNGLARTEGRRFEGPAWTTTSATDASMATSDILYAEAGDLIRTQVKTVLTNGAHTFEARMAAHQLLPLDL